MANPMVTSQQLKQIASFLERMEVAGIDSFKDLFLPANHNAGMRRNLANFCLLNLPNIPAELVAQIPCLPEGFKESNNQEHWRGLFGANYFGISEVARAGYRFTEKLLEQRKDVRLMRDGVLMSPEDSLKAAERCLKECPGQFACVACLPESVCSVHAREFALFIPELQGKDAWMLEQSQRKEWSRKKISDYYMLLRKEPIPDSHSMTSERQKIWLPEHHPCERFARPEHLVYGDSVCFKATKGHLCLNSGDVWARTLVRTAHGLLVGVGRVPRGLGVDGWCDVADPDAGIPSLWASF